MRGLFSGVPPRWRIEALMCCYIIALNYCIMKTAFAVLCKAMGRKTGIHNTLCLNGKYKS